MIDTQQCICVVGMHRSGTSCLTGIMQRFGVELGEVYKSNPHNIKGNREHPTIMALNDSVLEYNNGAWDRPVNVQIWTDEQALSRTQIITSLISKGTHFWGFKDPRFLLTQEFWLQELRPLYIATFRHPMAVATSLRDRNNMSIQSGLELWYAYNSRLHQLLEHFKVPLVNFDAPPETYLADVVSKLGTLGLPTTRIEYASHFFDPNLRHHSPDHSVRLPPKINQLYLSLLKYHKTNFSFIMETSEYK